MTDQIRPLTHVQWQALHDELWRQYLCRGLDGEEYCKRSLALGPDPARYIEEGNTATA